MACWNIVSISLLSDKEGKGEGIEKSFERWREHEEREERGERGEGERREGERGEGRSSRREIATIQRLNIRMKNRFFT